MKDILLVGIGGFIGSVARYKLGGWLLHLTTQEKFPYSTFAVNVVGCLAIGILAGLAERYELFGSGTRLFLFTGLLGGFTTFSAFGLDAMFLVRRGELWVAALYAGASVVVGIAAVWLGLKLISMFPRCGLTIRSSRTCFATATTWQKELAMLLPPLRRSA